jgi:hypothetical protein
MSKLKITDITKEMNIGPESVFYLKYKPIIDYFPPEILEIIFSHIPTEEFTLIDGLPDEDEEMYPDYPLKKYEWDFELYGNTELYEYY